MKYNFFVGAIIRNPKTGELAKVLQPPYNHPSNGQARLLVAIVNSNILFNTDSDDWDLIDPNSFYDTLDS